MIEPDFTHENFQELVRKVNELNAVLNRNRAYVETLLAQLDSKQRAHAETAQFLSLERQCTHRQAKELQDEKQAHAQTQHALRASKEAGDDRRVRAEKLELDLQSAFGQLADLETQEKATKRNLISCLVLYGLRSVEPTICSRGLSDVLLNKIKEERTTKLFSAQDERKSQGAQRMERHEKREDRRMQLAEEKAVREREVHELHMGKNTQQNTVYADYLKKCMLMHDEQTSLLREVRDIILKNSQV